MIIATDTSRLFLMLLTIPCETMMRQFWHVPSVQVLGPLFCLGSILWSSCVGERASLPYRYLDSKLFCIPDLHFYLAINALKHILMKKRHLHFVAYNPTGEGIIYVFITISCSFYGCLSVKCILLFYYSNCEPT